MDALEAAAAKMPLCAICAICGNGNDTTTAAAATRDVNVIIEARGGRTRSTRHEATTNPIGGGGGGDGTVLQTSGKDFALLQMYGEHGQNSWPV